MNCEDTFDSLNWYVIHTLPRQEDRADKNLRAWRVETLAPKARKRRYNEFTGGATYLTTPLFPRYIFARFRINDLYHKVRFTRGVENLVSFNGYPTPVADEIITLIQSRMLSDGFVKFEDDLAPGVEVIIKEGPFRSFTGVFERDMNDADRVRILLQTVSYQAHVVIDRDKIKKLERAACYS